MKNAGQVNHLDWYVLVFIDYLIKLPCRVSRSLVTSDQSAVMLLCMRDYLWRG